MKQHQHLIKSLRMFHTTVDRRRVSASRKKITFARFIAKCRSIALNVEHLLELLLLPLSDFDNLIKHERINNVRKPNAETESTANMQRATVLKGMRRRAESVVVMSMRFNSM